MRMKYNIYSCIKPTAKKNSFEILENFLSGNSKR